MRVDAWVLCAEFVQRIVSEACAGVAENLPGDIPDVDWASIWRAGDGAPSNEAAIGQLSELPPRRHKESPVIDPSRFRRPYRPISPMAPRCWGGCHWRALTRPARTPSCPWSRASNRPNHWRSP